MMQHYHCLDGMLAAGIFACLMPDRQKERIYKIFYTSWVKGCCGLLVYDYNPKKLSDIFSERFELLFVQAK